MYIYILYESYIKTSAEISRVCSGARTHYGAGTRSTKTRIALRAAKRAEGSRDEAPSFMLLPSEKPQ